MTKTVLVLGATGGVGGETARALLRHGWRARALARRIPAAAEGIEWIAGDALDQAAVIRAAAGADAIVHAVNPPGYRNWDRLVLPMLANSIAAAQAAGARLALPGTVYNYDARSVAVAVPDTPQRPDTRKGAIRAEMERMLADAPGLRALVLRAGDFFGPRAANNWLSQGMVKPGRPVRSLLYPGRRGVGHAWAYLPDVGEAFARLLDIEQQLPGFARHHFAGHWIDGAGFAAALAEAAGHPVRVRGFPWGLLPLVAPFNATMRELIEMRGFWRHPLRLEDPGLEAAIGPEPRTPLIQALRTTLAALGCLEGAAEGGNLDFSVSGA
ncbi:NAD-dependent epimerase/dehydratase family protein [Sphingomonas canadensis]|uniref:NAD-dependent epimerase/dehydratase family protein n=1 Tax=Sphingomonas canadensis TaxID=1219257 RepID=A0ABW3H086_9SPHN|nr:NAD(P)H-binding protein [Sphingomonas canadensis]MCW3835236.1 NAD(P)H-binding protein [Sphingomonas canadensis]